MIRTTAMAAALALVASTSASFACDPATTNDCKVTTSTQTTLPGGAAGTLGGATGLAIAGFALVTLIVIADDSDSGSH